MDYVTREEWGARPPRNVSTLGKDKQAVVHHSASEVFGAKACRQHQNYHMDARDYADIAYSWLVDTDGTIYEGRGWGVLSAATGGFNSRSYSCMAMGDYRTRKPTDALLEGFAAVWGDGIGKGWLATPIVQSGHRDHGTSTCPGDNLYRAMPEILRHLNDPPAPEEDPMYCTRGDRGAAVARLQHRLVLAGADPGKVDGVYGAKTAGALGGLLGLKPLDDYGPWADAMTTAKIAQRYARGEVAKITHPEAGGGLTPEEADRLYVRRGSTVKLP